MSDQEKVECTKALSSIAPLLADAEKAAIMYRAMNPDEAPQRVLVKLVEMVRCHPFLRELPFIWLRLIFFALPSQVATHRQAAQFAQTGIFTQHTKTVEQARGHLAKFIQHVRSQVHLNGLTKPLPSNAQQPPQQPPNANASTSSVINPPSSNELPLAAGPSPNAFVPPTTLRREDLRAPPAKRARNSSSGGSPAAMYGTGNTPTPIVLDHSPASERLSPPSARKDSARRPNPARTRSSSDNNHVQSSTPAVLHLARVQEQLERNETETKRGSGGNEMTGVVDNSSILGLQMEESDRTRLTSGGLQQQQQQQQPDVEKDPVAFFENQWSRLQAAHSSDPQVLTRAMHDLRRQSLQSTGSLGSPNVDGPSSVLNNNTNIYSPSNHISPYGTSSSLPMFNLALHQRQRQQQQQQQRYPQPQHPSTSDPSASANAMAKAAAEEESFDISFFIDSSQYLDEEDQSRPTSPKPHHDPSDTSTNRPPQSQSSSSASTSTTHPPPPITPSAAQNPPENPSTAATIALADDAQTPDLLDSTLSSNGGAQPDESPASTKEALSPHPVLLPFRPTSSSSSSTNAYLNASTLSDPSKLGSTLASAGGGEGGGSGMVNSGEDGQEGGGAGGGGSTWTMGEQAFYGLGDEFAWEGTSGGGSSGWLIN
jgi:hypothetical protein